MCETRRKILPAKISEVREALNKIKVVTKEEEYLLLLNDEKENIIIFSRNTN